MPLQLPIFVIFIYFVYKIYYKLRYKLPPGPYAWPIIGNLYNMKPERLQSYFEWSKTFGPIISVWIGSNLNIVVSNSQLAKEVLKDNDQQLAYRHRSWVLSKSTKGGKDFIWADYGPHYIKVRKVCTIELFSFKSLEALRHIREDEVKSMVGSIFKNCINIPQNQGGSLMVRKYLGSLAFNIVTRIVFGKRFEDKEGVLDTQGLELKAILDNEQNKTALLSILQTLWWLEWLFLFKNKEFSQHLSRKNKLVQQIIEEHKVEVEKNGYAKQHFVAALIGMQKDYQLSEDTIAGLLWDMITAGVDTIAISIEWALAQLVKNPRVQKKAQEELDRVIGQDRIMTESDIPNLPYLQCVVKEALRLHPPTPLMLPHKANSNVKVGGYDIPKGANVIVNVWALGRDQEFWKSPLEFRPERFMEEDVDIKGHDFRLLPFGAGRRICPAAQLSSILLTSMLGHLLHHFYWTLPQDVQPDEIDMMEIPGLVTYMRTPLQVVPIQRLPQHLYNHVV